MTSKRKAKRDNNVLALYDCENHELPFGCKFANLFVIQEYVNRITESTEWQILGNVPCHVRVFDWGESQHSEARGPNEIWLARKHWDTQAVLHELAHIATPKAAHGPRWVRAYLLLVIFFMGSFYADLYTKAFKRIGVKL